MRNLILFGFLLLVGLLPATSQNSAISSHFTFSGTGAADLISMQLRIPDDGVATYTYYEALGWGGYAGGYAGIQQSPSGRNYIFSIWDNDHQRGPIKEVYTGYGTTTESFGGEGTGLKSWTFAIPWETDAWYTLTARCWPVGDHTYYGYWIKDGVTGEWKHLVTMDVDLDNLSFPSQNDAFLEDWMATGYNRREMHMRNSWRRTLTGAWVPSHSGKHQVNYWDYDDETKRSYNYKTNWDAGTQTDDTGSYYKMISGGNTTVNSISNGTTFSLPISEQQPIAEKGEVNQLTANHSGYNLSLSWNIVKTKLPQFSYQIDIYNNASMTGDPVASYTKGAPHERSCQIEFKEAPGTYYGRFTLVDLFDNTFNQDFSFIVEEKQNDIGLLRMEAMNDIGCLSTELGLGFSLANYGSQPLSNFTASVYLNGVFLQSKEYSCSLARFDEAEFAYDDIALGISPVYDVKLIVDFSSETYTDENLNDNELSLSIPYEGQVLNDLNISVKSVSSYYSGRYAENMFDNDNSTFWHNNWGIDAPLPHEFVFDLEQTCTLTGMDLLNRQNNSNGLPKDAEVYFSHDGVTWSEPIDIEFLSTIYWQTISFEGTYEARYIKLKITSTILGSNVCSIAELKFRGCDVGSSTDINKTATESTLTVRTFPNPLIGFVKVEIKADKPIRNMNLFDLNGKLVMTCNECIGLTDTVFTLNLSVLRSGIYFLNIHTLSDVEIVKLIKV